MNNLIIKRHTQLSQINSKKKQDILSIYGVPEMLDNITRKERSELLNRILCGTVFINSLNECNHAEDFIIEIPYELRKLLKEGKATFDNSSKSSGSYTPNIRIKNEKGIAGQATISKGTDDLAITRSISNLAMMGMIQSVLAKLDDINEKLDDIIIGQKNDRIGEVIGHFKSFMDLYTSIKNDDEMRSAANLAYMNIHSGLAKIHLQIDEYRKKLDKAPQNHLKVFWNGICHPFTNTISKYQKIYSNYVCDLQLYNRLILLSDVLLYLKGDYEAMKRSHISMNKYCQEYMDESFKKKMTFLTNGHIDGLYNIQNHIKALNDALDGYLDKNLIIECNHEEVKLINSRSNEPKDI